MVSTQTLRLRWPCQAPRALGPSPAAAYTAASSVARAGRPGSGVLVDGVTERKKQSSGRAWPHLPHGSACGRSGGLVTVVNTQTLRLAMAKHFARSNLSSRCLPRLAL